VAFWIDYASVDQDDPQAGIEALPLYAAACPVLVSYMTQDYNSRAWTRVERVISYAYSDTAIPIQVSGGFLHRRQSPKVEQVSLLDPKMGLLTREGPDRPRVDALCQSAAEFRPVLLGSTAVPTLCLTNDDELPETTVFDAFVALHPVADSVALGCACCVCCLPGFSVDKLPHTQTLVRPARA
jgi:hypothetical protein